VDYEGGGGAGCGWRFRSYGDIAEHLHNEAENIYTTKREAHVPVISFEFFPPKTEEGERTFFLKTLPA
jgi:hypothetical protein